MTKITLYGITGHVEIVSYNDGAFVIDYDIGFQTIAEIYSGLKEEEAVKKFVLSAITEAVADTLKNNAEQ